MAMIVALALMMTSSVSIVSADQAKGNPLGKVLELLSSLEVKIIKEGEKEAAAFDEFFQWCDKASQNLNFEIKTYTSTKEKQEAKIEELSSDIAVATSKVEDLSGAISKNEEELNAATRIRSKESADFATAEKELVETTDTLSRAISIISSEMAKNPAALAQIDSTSIATLTQTLSLVVEAAGVSSADHEKLIALVQSSQGDEELGGAEDKDERCECVSVSCSMGSYSDQIKSGKSVEGGWGPWCFTQGNCGDLNQKSKIDCPGNFWARPREGAFESSVAPASSAYKSQSKGIVELLEDLKDKADMELSEARKTEKNSQHNFDMMKQSLDDQMAADTKDLNEEKSAKEDAQDEKAKTEGDLAITVPDLKDDKASLETFHQDCMRSAADHEATMAARKEERTVIETAKKILREASSGPPNRDDDRCECVSLTCDTGSYTAEIINRKSIQRDWGAWCFTKGNCNSLNQQSEVDCPGNYWARGQEGAFEPQATSLVQLASTSRTTMKTRADLANSEVVAMVKKLAHQQHSAALAQLASRIAVVAKYGARDGADPFAKIKGLISDMINKLVAEAESESTEKGFCDEQVAKTEAKKGEFDMDIAKLVAKIDQAAARSAELKEEGKELHEEIALLAKTLADLSNLRTESHANYLSATAELKQGLTGVQKALGLLRDYYGTAAAFVQEATGSGADQPAKPEQHAKAGGAGGKIIQILEVVESDFANGLSKEETEESDAEAQHQEIFQDKKLCKTTKESDLKYKNQERVALQKSISELTGDKDNVDTQLSAVLQYYARVKERCVAQPESYEGRAARREAEVNGLKEALSILESEAAFIQKKRRMRGNAIQ